MQKINFITHLFFKMLKEIANIILGNLGMPGHAHLKWLYQFEETFDVYLQTENQLHPSHFPWDIAKILQTSNFGYFGNAWLLTPKVILSPCRKLSSLSAGKKSTSSRTLFWRYCKDMQTSYFEYFGHTWLRTLKIMVWTCRKLPRLSASTNNKRHRSLLSWDNTF